MNVIDIRIFLRRLIYLLLILTFAILPSISIDRLFDSTQSGKFIVFAYVSLFLFLVYTHYLIFVRKIVIRINPIDLCFMAYLIYIIFIRTTQVDSGFSTNYYQIIGLLLIYWIIRNATARLHRILFYAIVAGGVIQALYGSFQLYGISPSYNPNFILTGSFFNPGPYAWYLAVTFITALGLKVMKFQGDYGKRKADWLKYLLPISLIIIILIIPATKSRAAIIALVAGGLFIFIANNRIKFSLCRAAFWVKYVLMPVVMMAVVVGGSIALFLSKKNSSVGRLLIWNVSAEMIKQHPVLGVGYDNFTQKYMLYQATYLSNSNNRIYNFLADNSYYSFNEFLQLIVENGLLSLIIYFTGLYFLFKVRHLSTTVILSKAILASIIAFSLFSYSFQILPIKLCLILSIGIISSVTKNYVLTLNLSGLKTGLTILGLPIIWFVFYMGFKQTNKLFNGYNIWGTALTTYQSGNLPASIRQFKSVYPIFLNNGEFLMNYGKALSLNLQDRDAVNILSKARCYLNNTVIQTAIADSEMRLRKNSQAESDYILAVNMTPDHLYPRYLLAKFYNQTGQIIKAVSVARATLSLKVKVHSDATDEINNYMHNIIQRAVELGK